MYIPHDALLLETGDLSAAPADGNDGADSPS
jgi:hypothetical protein